MATVEAAARKQKIRSQTHRKDTVNQTNPTDLFYFISVCIDTGYARPGSVRAGSALIEKGTVGDYVFYTGSPRESERIMEEYHRRPASILKYIKSL